MSHSINLDTDGQLGPAGIDDDNQPGWWVQDNVVHERSETNVVRSKLPKGAARIALTKMGKGRSQLSIGAFTRTSVVVTGPTEVLEKLREAVL